MTKNNYFPFKQLCHSAANTTYFPPFYHVTGLLNVFLCESPEYKLHYIFIKDMWRNVPKAVEAGQYEESKINIHQSEKLRGTLHVYKEQEKKKHNMHKTVQVHVRWTRARIQSFWNA